MSNMTFTKTDLIWSVLHNAGVSAESCSKEAIDHWSWFAHVMDNLDDHKGEHNFTDDDVLELMKNMEKHIRLIPNPACQQFGVNAAQPFIGTLIKE